MAIGDPIPYLLSDGDDRLILEAVLTRAWKLRREELKWLAAQVANNVARALGGRR